MHETALNILSALAASALLFTAAGCTPSLSVTVADSKTATVAFSSSLSGTALKTAQTFSGSDSGGPLFSAQEIKTSVEAAGFTGVSADVSGSSSFSVTAVLDDLGSGIAAVPGAVTLTGNGETGTLTLKVSPEIIRQSVQLLPEDSRTYLDLLMSPVLTGDTMTEKEYTDLVSSVYGSTLAGELSAARFTVTLTAPHKKAVQKYTVPLVRMLTLSAPLNFSVSW